MPSPVRALGQFLDTLVLNVYPTDRQFQVERREMDGELKAELQDYKERAQEAEEDIPTRFAFRGLPLLMKTKGSEGFQWILDNGKISLAVKRNSKMLLWAQVRCSSEYLWEVRDYSRILSEVYTFLISLFDPYLILQLSAVDLAMDVVGLDFGTLQNVKEHFITRAQLTDEHPQDKQMLYLDGPDAIKQRWGRLTGLPFGARNAALSALIYDKTHEIKYKRPEKAWFYDLWRESARAQGFEWTEDMPVWRIEMRFKRAALHEMKQEGEGAFHGIDDAFDLERHLPGLWAYAVGHVDGGQDGLPDGWLRYVSPSADSNRSRWPVHPDWEVIQAGFAPETIELSLYEREQEERDALLQEMDDYLEEHPFTQPTGPSEEAPKKQRDYLRLVDRPAVVLPAPEVVNLSPYIRKRKREVNVRRMVAQIAGCATTYQAWHCSAEDFHPDRVAIDLSATFQAVYRDVEEYLKEHCREYQEDVKEKFVIYRIESDAA